MKKRWTHTRESRRINCGQVDRALSEKPQHPENSAFLLGRVEQRGGLLHIDKPGGKIITYGQQGDRVCDTQPDLGDWCS